MVRIVVVVVFVLSFLRRLKQGRRRGKGLGVIATAALGMAGAVVGGLLGDLAVGRSGVARDLVAGLTAVLGAVAFVAAGEVLARRRARDARR
ncbi:MAG: hypothetical protein ACT4PP_16515 [Sporichthyaceae bacterium]